MTDDSPDAMRSALNVLRVIEAFDGDETLGVSELARRVGLPKTTVQRVVMTLRDGGWLSATANPPTRWRPSTAFFALASRFFRGWNLRSAAAPILRDLRDRTMEAVTLVVPQSRYVVHVDRVESLFPIQATSSIGSLTPIHASSSGKAILSHLSEREVIELLPPTLERFTDNTIIDRNSLMRDLETTRERGYSVSWQEYRYEVIGVGAAITNLLGRPIAAISTLIPQMRISSDRIAELGPLVAASALAISAQIGYGPPTISEAHALLPETRRANKIRRDP